MARKKMLQGLPPLPTRRRSKAKEHKGAQLLELLQGIAIASQREEPQGFYPLREVARHFTVPISTVSRVYGELEEEGILASIRGSKTLLQGVNFAVGVLLLRRCFTIGVKVTRDAFSPGSTSTISTPSYGINRGLSA